MQTQQFIEDAIAGGWNKDVADWMKPYDVEQFAKTCLEVQGRVHEILLDPLAWQAVEKTRNWCNEADGHEGKTGCNFQHARAYWHRFIDHLADGKTIDEALASL